MTSFYRFFSIIVMLFFCASVFAQNSPYISKVYDFQPAPGQFVNLVPEWEEGDTKEDMIRKTEEALLNNERGMVSLGAWGGFIVFGFDHPVVNVKGKADFRILGNALFSNENPGTGQQTGGSSEPGIVYVSYDANGNGLPDDEWFELAGSEFHNPGTVRNYKVTYYKPAGDHQPVPDPEDTYLIDAEYIRWNDNQGGNGYVAKNASHRQDYWPEWMDEVELSFEGQRLPNNFEQLAKNMYLQYPYAFGYADNAPNDDDASGVDIEWAVDKAGNPVSLAEIHFIKVQTAVNQYCGWLGESSTEIMGAVDLHPNAETGLNSFPGKDVSFSYNRMDNQLRITSSETQTASIYTISGMKVKAFTVYQGNNSVSCEDLPHGMYLLSIASKNIKFIK